jgi:hypothetical protein
LGLKYEEHTDYNDPDTDKCQDHKKCFGDHSILGTQINVFWFLWFFWFYCFFLVLLIRAHRFLIVCLRSPPRRFSEERGSNRGSARVEKSDPHK